MGERLDPFYLVAYAIQPFRHDDAWLGNINDVTTDEPSIGELAK